MVDFWGRCFRPIRECDVPPRRPFSHTPQFLCVVLSRKVDCDVCYRAAKLKITLKLAVAPSSLNTLLKNVPVLSEASWNKPVDRVLLGVSYAWWF